MIKYLPADKRKLAITELLHRADDPHVSLSDRNDYLLAASNLVEGLDNTTRQDLLNKALQLVTTLPPSEYDKLESKFTHKLGSLRVSSPDMSTQSKALYLAACLADEGAQRPIIKQQAYLLLGVSDRSDYWVARALQQLGNASDNDLAFLAGQSWAPRAFAASRWVQHSIPEFLGARLATDQDPRVRHALAEALAESTLEPAHMEAWEFLTEDPAYSVRSLLQQHKRHEAEN